jgi:lysozyme
MREVPREGVDFIKTEEKCVLVCYSTDGAGVPTIGYGSTSGLTKADVGVLKINRAEAERRLRSDLATAAAALQRKIGADVVALLTESQYAALVSFVFNLGTGNPKKPEWSIWKVLRAKQFDQVPMQMMRFVNAKQPDGTVKRLAGLVSRRTAEVALWHEDDADAAPAPPSSETRSVATPPTPADTKPLTQSKSFMTAAATTIAAASGAVGEISKTVSPFAAQSDVVAHIVSTLAMIAAGLAVATLLFVYLKKRSA